LAALRAALQSEVTDEMAKSLHTKIINNPTRVDR